MGAAEAYSFDDAGHVYRSPSGDEAIAELCREAGAQFDPDVVTALVGVLERDVGELERAA